MMMKDTYSLKAQGGLALSKNFRVREFACRDGSDAVLVAAGLVDLLQRIRDHFDRPVVIHSGYRTAAYNTKVGGASRSQHLYGRAADISIDGVTPLEIAQYAEALLPKSGGIGLYRTFAHVDVRASRSRWDSRSGKETVVSGWPGYSEPSEAEQAVAWITEKGVMLGSEDGDLMLDEPLTRRQLAVMLYRYHKTFM